MSYKREARYSEIDSRGVLYVDCFECEKGPIGNAVDRCASASRIKKGLQGGCFSGVLRLGLEVL